MECRFRLQDPTDPATKYLYEEIISAARTAASWRGMYAFGSQGGVDQLLGDEVVAEFFERGGELDLVVGIDAVTNRPTLQQLLDIQGLYPRFVPKVFWNPGGGLFHPKFSHIVHADGRQTLITGSGNLTPGGLRENYEGYVVVEADAGEILNLEALDEFIVRHGPNLREIDEEALERAARNIIRGGRGTKRRAPIEALDDAVLSEAEEEEGEEPARIIRPITGEVLVAQVPGAGGRWAQVHFNARIMLEYFKITDRETQRLYLTHVLSDASRQDEEVRRYILSERNLNPKVEIGAARGLAYPGVPPVLVFVARGTRTFEYMLVMPGEPRYADLVRLTTARPKFGKGLPRVVIPPADLAAAWPDCPLLRPA